MTADARHAIHSGRPAKTAWQRGRILAFGSLAAAALLLGHEYVPHRWGNLGSLVQTFLPWLGLAVPLGILAALVGRSALAVLAVLVPLAAWVWVFLPQLRPAPPAAEPADLVVVQHNASDTNADVAGTIEVLLAAHPDVVTLTEVTDATEQEYASALGAELPHHSTQGTVGVWSRFPLEEAAAVDIRPAGADATWDRCLRVVLRHDDAAITLFVAHLPSVRIGSGGFETGQRDGSTLLLADAVAAERNETVLVAGDLNAARADDAIAPLTRLVTADTRGFPFSYPAAFPVVQIDHVLARGADVTATRTLPRTPSDHLPVVAHVSFR